MAATLFNKYLVVIAALVAFAGTVDAALSREGDLFVVFLVTLVLLVVMLFRLQFHRPGVSVRADLVRWMRARAAVTGQRVEDVVDRAIAVYRQGFEGEPAADGPFPEHQRSSG